MFKQIHVFVRLGTMFLATLLIVLAIFTVHHDMAQASSGARCGGAATISGTVLDPDGNPLSGIKVGARIGKNLAGIRFQEHIGENLACPYVVTDDAGNFTIEDLPADDWTLLFESYFDAEIRYGSPEPFVVTVADGATVTLAEPIQMKPPAAFVQIVTQGTENASPDIPYRGQLVFNPLSPMQGDNGQNETANCGTVAFYGPATVREIFYRKETVDIANIAPGTYCMYAELSDSMDRATAQNFGTAYQAPTPRVVEIPADPELVDLGFVEFGQPTKQISVNVVDEEGVGAAGVYVRATHTQNNVSVDAMTDQSGEALLAVSSGSWEVTLRSAPDVDLGDSAPLQVIDFAAESSAETATVQAQGQRIRSAITGRLVQDDGAPLPDDVEWDRLGLDAWSIDESSSYALSLNESGRFSATVPAGTYRIYTYAGRLAKRGLFEPVPFTVTVASEQVTAIGDVRMLPMQITATVQDEGGNPTSKPYYRVIVNGTPDRLGNTDCTNTYAFKDDYPPRTPVVVDGAGDYNGLLQIGSLPTGEYCLIVRYNISSPLSNYYEGRVTSVATITPEESTVDLGMLVAEKRNKSLTGRVTQADGTGIPNFPIRAQSMTDRGWARTVTAADGSYALHLEQGEWTISIGENVLYRRGPITIKNVTYLNRKWFIDNASQTASFANDETAETQQLDWELPDVNAAIRGTIRKPDGTPAIGLDNVLVVAYSRQWEVLLYAHVDPATGSYTLPIVGGEWRVRYENTGEYESADSLPRYGQSSGTVSLTVGNDETFEQDFTMVSLDATIRGQLLNADGSPVAYGVVNLRNRANTSPNAISERQIEVFNGTFEVNVEAGGVYDFNIISTLIPDLPYHSKPEQTVTATADEPAMVTIQLPELDAEAKETTETMDFLHLPLMFQP